MEATYPCVCCGHRTFDEPPGSSAICPVCFWEDDGVQLRFPCLGGGANTTSLVDAQRRYATVGADRERTLPLVRPPTPDEPQEDGWRPIDPELDRFEDGDGRDLPWPDDRTRLYWWRPTFWRPADRSGTR